MGKNRIAAVVLAAGRATRMGEQKLLLRLEGRTLIERVVDAVLQAPVDEVVVVLGHEAARVVAALGDRPVRKVFNERYAEGQSTSLLAGIKAAGGAAGAYLVVLGDQPFLTPELIDRLLERYRRTACAAVRPVFQGKPGHPVLI
ncbi:MAG: nucleotidyltransferase family protein, partial [Peptococcaceae bacterium]|nr:nucleotidyltransferase family protein [Peptococcaceae bacterium]